MENGNNTRMFCEGSLGKMPFRTFREQVGPRILSLESVGLITLEQISEHFSGRKEKMRRILISKTLMVRLTGRVL